MKINSGSKSKAINTWKWKADMLVDNKYRKGGFAQLADLSFKKPEFTKRVKEKTDFKVAMRGK